MPRAELSQKNKYYLPKQEYLTAVHWCMRYPDWKRELSVSPDMSGAIRYDLDRVQTSAGNKLEDIAIKRVEIENKVMIMENAAKRAAPGFYMYLLDGVGYGLTFWQLKKRGIPCGKNLYYAARQYFYWLIAQKI